MDDDARELQGLFKTLVGICVCVLSSDWSNAVSECLNGVRTTCKTGLRVPQLGMGHLSCMDKELPLNFHILLPCLLREQGTAAKLS